MTEHFSSSPGRASEALDRIWDVVHTPTKATNHRAAERHFMADFDAIRQIIKDARAAPQSPGVAYALTWRPMETAPRDGTWIIARRNDSSRLYQVRWDRDDSGFMNWCTTVVSYGDGMFSRASGGWLPAPQPATPVPSTDGDTRG